MTAGDTLARIDGALAAGWAQARAAVERSRNAPLSARHALHAAAALDQLSDLAHPFRTALLPAAVARAGDILSYRAALRTADPALGAVMDLTACRAEGPHLRLIAAEVPPEGFAQLPVGDLMVSLYNAGTVPRLFLVSADGQRLPVQPLLADATAWWHAVLG